MKTHIRKLLDELPSKGTQFWPTYAVLEAIEQYIDGMEKRILILELELSKLKGLHDGIEE